MVPELTKAAVAYLAEALEAEGSRWAALARWVADTAGEPEQAGVDALLSVAELLYGELDTVKLQ